MDLRILGKDSSCDNLWIGINKRAVKYRNKDDEMNGHMFHVRHIDVDNVDVEKEWVHKSTIDGIILSHWKNVIPHDRLMEYWSYHNYSLVVTDEDGKPYIVCNRSGRERLLEDYKTKTLNVDDGTIVDRNRMKSKNK